MKQINLRLTELTLAAIDEQRGLAPRNAWISQAIDEKMIRDSGMLMASQVPIARQTEEGARKVVDTLGHLFKEQTGTMRCAICGKTMGAHR